MRNAAWLLAGVLSLLLAVSVAAQEASSPQPAAEVLAADTPRTTVGGNTFIAPAGWTISVRDRATILEAPEGNSRIALVDVTAKDAGSAVTAAWAQYGELKWPVELETEAPDKDGWSSIRVYYYRTAPNEKRGISALARKANDLWTVVIYDMDQAVGEKRAAQVALIMGRLLPKGYQRETFAGKKGNELDAKRIAELARFVDEGRKKLGVPAVSIGVIQNGKVVFAGGFGTRDLDGKEKADAETLYMIASNTKALTTLMLAKLVDEGRLTWETPVTKLLPSFKLGDADTTSRVLVKHLICACTGLPRQDLEWLFEFEGATPASAIGTLGGMQPTSKFGELFQYSNPLASAGGYVGGHVVFGDRELGAAYDEAMQKLVFAPLGMNATTFDFALAQKGNHARSHSADVDGKAAHALMALNYSVIPVRPAGGAWSNVTDMLKYVAMEIDEGMLPDGKRYIAKETLLARRAPQVAMSKDATYGMGLMVDRTWGVEVIHHGGDLIGYHSDMIWLPEHKVGAVILTNSDPGVMLRGPFSRKLLELLFDGRPQADADLASNAKRYFEGVAASRKLLTLPPDPAVAGKLAAKYANDALGTITVSRSGPKVVFDFGEWKSEMATRKEPDGTVSFVTVTPGMAWQEFIPGTGEKRTLIIRDAQHEYVFEEL